MTEASLAQLAGHRAAHLVSAALLVALAVAMTLVLRRPDPGGSSA